MHYLTARITKMFLLLIFQVFLHSTLCVSEGLDFLDTEDPQGIPILRRDIKIPVGFMDDTFHNLTLARGTLISEIPSKISQKRQELGLSPHVPLEQQDAFFQDLSWQTTKDVTVTAPMPGRIVQFFASKGQPVKAGDHLCTVEAMKMELTINSSSPGEITRIDCKTGDFAYQDSVLFTLLPTSPKWEDVNPTEILENMDLLIPFFPWTISSPVKISNTHADTSPNGEQENVIAEEEHNQPTQALQEGNLSCLSIQNPPSEFVQISPEESVFIEQNPISLPILQPEGSVPITHHEQETVPQNSPIPKTPPMNEVVTLMPESLNIVVEENNNDLTMEDSPQIPSLPLETPLMTLLTLTTPQVPERQEHDLAFLPEPQQETSILFSSNAQEIEQQNSPLLNAPPMNEVLTLMPESLNTAVEGNNNGLTTEDSPQVPSLPLETPLMTLLTLTTPQVPMRQEYDLAFLPESQQETSILFSSNAQEIEQQNSPLPDTSPMSEVSTLMPQAYPRFLKVLALQNSDLLSKLEFKNNEKDAKEPSFLKKRIEKEMCYNQLVFLDAKAKKSLREKLVNTSEDEIDFSMFSWSKWLFGLFVLGKLIFLIKTMTKLRLRYLRSKILLAYNFNDYRLINEKIASNNNQTLWPQEKRLKVHALLGY